MDRRKTAIRNVVYQDKQLVVTQSTRPVGLRFLGAVDASNVEAVAGLLDSTLRADSVGDVHIDVTGLEFSDVSGIRALVASAERADGSRKLVLHGLPALMARVMDVVGWTELPALTISAAEFPPGEPLDGEAPNDEVQARGSIEREAIDPERTDGAPMKPAQRLS
jgi:anti-anti-sigma factor